MAGNLVPGMKNAAVDAVVDELKTMPVGADIAVVPGEGGVSTLVGGSVTALIASHE